MELRRARSRSEFYLVVRSGQHTRPQHVERPDIFLVELAIPLRIGNLLVGAPSSNLCTDLLFEVGAR